MGHKRLSKQPQTPEEESHKDITEIRKQRENWNSEGDGALKKQSSFKIIKIQGKQMEGLEQDLNQPKSNESCLLELHRATRRKQSGRN